MLQVSPAVLVEELPAMKSIVVASQCQSPTAVTVDAGNIVGSQCESKSEAAVTV